ncbi:aTP-dependent DNA helicase PcrA [Ruminococcus sp. CAG:254]|jgi:DNA helicase-2/ATP-dependent DNA helicase PcrA|nr:aTP-dependent DNA helicase PcrA [Ruminococcus sp. CAG:254]
MAEETTIELKRAALNHYFQNLNTPQQQAVFHVNGPVLVLAGAGSGKTTAMIHRIVQMIHFGDGWVQANASITKEDAAYLKDYIADKQPADLERLCSILAVQPIQPWHILAITFTNKAANELRSRLLQAIGEECASMLHASTFHSACVRILRRSISKLGYDSNFTIYDTDDSQRLMKSCIADADVSEKQFPPRAVLTEISLAKDRMCSPEYFCIEAGSDYRKMVIGKLYKEYQNRLKSANALDFDDLIYKTVELLESFPEELEYYQNRFRYIMVDEYQDTNHAQFRLVQLLSQKHQNLCVVGDDDQSIYRFRGATIENILNFEKQFQNAVVIRLEQNYRSTKTILEAANDVIAHNAGRKEKTLWTDLEDGKKIIWYKAVDETDESRFVAEKIEKEVQNGASYQDFAVLYRMNAQSNNIERMFVKEKIPYHIYGGTRFYDRKEIKDVLAYMTILYNPFDMVRFKRIVNEPKRGIGDATMEMLENITRDLGISPIDVMRDSETYPVLSKKVAHLKKFALMIDELTDAVKTMQLDEFFDLLLQKTGYADYLKNMGEEGKIRLENVQELKSNILKYMKESELPSLENFLEEVSLYADAEQTETAPDTVSMMTIHAAKGLEFKTVFLIGMEENIFPSARSINSLDENDLEEERRLAYVAITRAKKQLCVSTTDRRMLFGMTTSNPRSRFLGEIQGDCMEQVQSKKNVAAGTRKVEMVQSISLQQQLASRRNHHPQKTAEKSVNYSVGTRVRHKIFGEGTILSITDMANDSMLEIGFDQVGTKKVMANFASSKMQVIS